MISKNILKLQNTFFTSLVFLFTISSIFKNDYSASVPIDLGGYSNETEISLIVNPDNSKPIPLIKYLDGIFGITNDFFQPTHHAKMHGLYKLKLNRFNFPQFVSPKYLHPDFAQSIYTFKKFSIYYQSLDDTDPFII